MPEVLLVQPNRFHGNIKTSHGHAGFAFLAAYSINKGHNAAVIDSMYEGIDNEEVMRRIIEINLDVLCFTARTPDIKECEKLAIRDKENKPLIKIIISGAHVTGLHNGVPAECEHFDFAVYGEGEITFFELLNRIEHRGGDFYNINGLIFRRNGEIIINRPRAYIMDLDSLLFPAWQLFPRGMEKVKCFFGIPRMFGDYQRLFDLYAETYYSGIA